MVGHNLLYISVCEDEIDLRARFGGSDRPGDPTSFHPSIYSTLLSFLTTVVCWPVSSGRPNPRTYILDSYGLKLEPVHQYNSLRRLSKSRPRLSCIAA
jgi:hypothetical protein